MIEYLPKWYRIDELIELVQFVGVNRPGYNVETEYPIKMVDIPQMFISSSTDSTENSNRENCEIFNSRSSSELY